ncbi:hypothetical protein [Bacillus sp. mrc49]|uniref:hypothetical protein n=1 Tax=Bacillus sp. mrc49 TaxID=2054913 RepID=UPI000C278594|nr:hypothetical protein [Bacillus sp. mrc49]PJN89888.1 hypothetical protein CVN76_13290 [Bacillus sp. mrc49]
MKNCKGYVYLELMAAFSVCAFLVLSILPILENVMTDRKNMIMKTEAHHLLYERLTAFMDGEVQGMEQEFIIQKKSYRMIWKDDGDSSGTIEGCVRYENASGKDESICDIAAK